ncbi:uncharacterized protein G2W53_001224 [Senna tora]|uniref:Retrotransposon gag domain-containing protein n=1 Tax=Senna tora TaxID=362788 RepID=A0A835CJ83_9FABA|nr:uncharacterized protein G2W53_001224 [Senna tora]
MENENNRKLYEYATRTIHLLSPSIRRPTIEANHFEINPNIIQLLQSHAQFGGFPTEDPIAHILNFLEVCDTFKQNRVSEEAIKLRLFPFSLRDRAKWWLNSLPTDSIITWEDLANKFLAKYFPPAWERFKDLLQRCPHHGFPKWLQVQTFYNGLYSTFQTTVDASADGSLMAKPVEVAYNLLETIALNNYHWQSERHMPRSATEINKVEVINALCAQIATLTKQVHSLRVQASVDAISSFISCELCGAKHLYDQCPENSKFEHYSSNPSWFNALSSSQESKPHPPSVESKPSMEDMPLTYLAKTEGSEKVTEGNLGTEEVDKEPVEEATTTEGCFEVCLVNDVVDNLANDDELKYHPIEPSKSSLSFNAKWDADDFVMNSSSLVQCQNFVVAKLLHLLSDKFMTYPVGGADTYFYNNPLPPFIPIDPG